MTDYKPGLYRVDSWRGKGLLAFRVLDRKEVGWIVLDGTDTRGLEDREVTDVRPLVVLDPSALRGKMTAAPSADELPRWFRQAADAHKHGAMTLGSQALRLIADQIEAQTRPAIEEPEGLGAVVEDESGTQFVKVSKGTWVLIGNATHWTWDEIDAVRVLPEGVQ